MFAMSDETSACEEEGRTHLNRGRQLSQVLVGEFQSAEIAHRTDPLAHLQTSDIVSSMLLRILQRQRALAC